MILNNHIATRFLTDSKFLREVITALYSKEAIAKWDYFVDKELDDAKEYGEDTFPMEVKEIGVAYIFLTDQPDPPNQNVNYYITETVTNKLDMLKISKKSTGFYDWSVFDSIPPCKKTFILHNNSLVRFNKSRSGMHFTMMSFTYSGTKGTEGMLDIDMFFVTENGTQVSDKVNKDRIEMVEKLIYRLLCFLYLTENDEVIVEPGRKNGTRKSGKIVNTLPYPLTIVDSRWNTTVIRTEGFPVSGHFRIQPCGPQMSQHKLIFIEPFQKNGYIRKAKSES